MAFSRDGKTAASVGLTNGVQLYDATMGQKTFGFAAEPRLGVECVAFSPDGKTLATASNVIRLWDLATLSDTAEIPGKEADRKRGTSVNGKVDNVRHGQR